MGDAVLDFGTIAEWINTAALVAFVVKFIKGSIIPKSVLDRIIELYEKRATDLTEGILQRIDQRFQEHAKDTEKRTDDIIRAVKGSG